MSTDHGYVALALPRFYEVVEKYQGPFFLPSQPSEFIISL